MGVTITLSLTFGYSHQIIVLLKMATYNATKIPNTASSVVKAFFASIYLFWAESSMLQPCLAFQATNRSSRGGPPPTAASRQYVGPNVPEEFSLTPPAISPQADMTALEAVTICMGALMQNDRPRENAGLETCFNFSSDRCRASLGGSLEAFVQYASNPTFGSMTNANGYSVLNVGPLIAAGTTRGQMQTVLVQVTPAEGDERKFLWTMQQERRPPRQGFWLVHECIFVENSFALTF